jgi:hypothetical protein
MQRMQRMQRGNSYHQGREQLHHYNCLLMPTGPFYNSCFTGCFISTSPDPFIWRKLKRLVNV